MNMGTNTFTNLNNVSTECFILTRLDNHLATQANLLDEHTFRTLIECPEILGTNQKQLIIRYRPHINVCNQCVNLDNVENLLFVLNGLINLDQ
jgi:hypothetical protein